MDLGDDCRYLSLPECSIVNNPAFLQSEECLPERRLVRDRQRRGVEGLPEIVEGNLRFNSRVNGEKPIAKSEKRIAKSGVRYFIACSFCVANCATGLAGLSFSIC